MIPILESSRVVSFSIRPAEGKPEPSPPFVAPLGLEISIQEEKPSIVESEQIDTDSDDSEKPFANID
jgi:hypothetical protein